jgi:hypothetical protein
METVHGGQERLNHPIYKNSTCWLLGQHIIEILFLKFYF